MAYASPVPGVLHPKGWVRPAGNLAFQITRDCADHRATNQGCALDIWNGRCDGKVLAARGGEVVYRYDPEGIVRIDHGDGDISGYAHMSAIRVAFGQVVPVGFWIGTVHDAHSASIPNFSGCHLHFAIERNGVEIDPAPLLAGADELTEITLTPALGTCSIAAGSTVDGWNAQGLVKRQSWPTGSSFPSDALAVIKQTPDRAPRGTFRRCSAGVYAGLYIPATQVSFKPTPAPVPAGFTQADIDAAVTKATRPLQDRIAAIKAKVAAGAVDISDD